MRMMSGRRWRTFVCAAAIVIAVPAFGAAGARAAATPSPAASTPSPAPAPTPQPLPPGAQPLPLDPAHPGATLPRACDKDSDFIEVPHQGPSCWTGKYFKVRTQHGTLNTHGPDRAAAGSTVVAGNSSPLYASSAQPWCTQSQNGPNHFEIIYTHPTDRADSYSQFLPYLQTMVGNDDYALHVESAPWGIQPDFRVLCDSGNFPAVFDVPLSTSTGNSTFSSIASDVSNYGFNKSNAKYFVYFDGVLGNGLAGQGNLAIDDSPGPGNGNNSGPNWAIDYGYLDPGVWMHESGHTLGAVQLSSPHSSGGLHCNDGQDVMCYADGGSTSAYNPGVCTDRTHYDCNWDDYFNPSPPPGSYLATHWDVINSSFLSVVLPPSVPIDFAGEGIDYQLWRGHEPASGFTPLGGILNGAPAMATVPTSGGSTHLYVVTGGNQKLYVRTDGSGFVPLTSAFTYCVDGPGLAVSGSTATVACMGPDHAMYTLTATLSSSTGMPTSVSAWQKPGGYSYLLNGPELGLVGGHVHALVVGGDTGVYDLDLGSSGSTYQRTSWLCSGRPALANSGSASYFGCNGSGALWVSVNPGDGSGWHATRYAGGLLLGGPGAAASSQGAAFVVEGVDRQAWGIVVDTSGRPFYFTPLGGQFLGGLGAG